MTGAFAHLLNAEARPAPTRLLIVGPDTGTGGIPESAVNWWQNEGHFNVNTVRIGSDADFANALLDNGKYDQLVYLGHGVPGALATAAAKGGNIVADGPSIWAGTKASQLNFKNLTVRILTSPKIVLCSCNSDAGYNGRGGSVAQSFANSARVSVLGTGAGISFLGNGEPVIRGIYIFGNMIDRKISGSGGWKISNPK